eukprot:TRINITY_DN900_c0_g1_i1.p1 TRINITY_DN900_c0_g1~~TRINITY_DN900_c0_g1_i1.p1  ORF type:complete len:237 (-),score=49.16 TRINITY_DN900_c0_g1_i1:37-720(-)
MNILTILIIFAILYILITKFLRPIIYDILITKLTTFLYESVMNRLANGDRVLDVGIGTGTALCNNERLMREKDLKVVGVDYDLDYVKKCQVLFDDKGLGDCCSVVHDSIYDFVDDELYNGAYFSSSLMIMPDPVAALNHVADMLTEDGKIYITQTFELKRNRMLEIIKPLFKYILTIDFGGVTYEKDFLKTIEQSNLKIDTNEVLQYKNFVSSNQTRVYKLIICSRK